MANGSATDAQLDNQYDLYAVCYHQVKIISYSLQSSMITDIKFVF